jgi:hypothetical protein
MKRYAAILVTVVALAAPATAAASTPTSTLKTPSAQIDEASWGTGVQPDAAASQTDEQASWGT